MTSRKAAFRGQRIAMGRHLLLSTAIGVSALVAPAAAMAQTGDAAMVAQAEAATAFSIPPQPLSSALTAFGVQSGYQVSVDQGLLSGRQSPGVSGTLPPREALARLLAGSGLTYRFTGATTVTLVEMSGTGGAVQLPPVTVEGQGRRPETATSPVDGYVVSRAATGTKTDTPLLETPQSISVVPRDQITEQNAQTLNQVVRYTAGVTPETRGAVATRYDQLTIRGFDADMYWNGMKQQDLWYISPQLDPYLLERVEVLKGPTSVLYGQAPAGGIVNQVSKRPTDTPLREVGIEAGTNNHYRLTADFSDTLDARGNLLYRFTAVGLTEDGQINMTENERIAIAPSVTWRPDDDSSLTLFGLYQNDPEGNSYGGIPAEGTVLPNPLGKLPVDFYDGDPSFEKFFREQQALGYEFDRRLSDIWTVRLNGRGQRTTMAYDSVYANGVQADNRTLDRGAASSREALNAFAFDNQIEGRLATGPVSHTVLGGFDYQRAKGHYTTGFGPAPTLDIFNPDYSQTITPPVRTRTDLDAEQYGFYLQDQIRYGGLIVTLAGRHDTAEQTTEVGGVTNEQKDRAWTGKAGVTYVFDNGLAPYISYAESFTPQTGTDFAGNPFDPEEGTQYELGVKYQPAGFSGLFTAAVFELTRSNLTTADPDHPGFSVQTGEARSRGLELEARVGLTDRIDVIGAYTYLDTEVTKDNSGLEGNRLGAVPEHQASAWAVYRMPEESAFKGVSLGGGVRYVGSTLNPANDIRVPSFTLVDAAVDYDLGALSSRFAGMSLALNVKNLFDKEYVASCYYGEWCAYGYERTITAGLRYRW